MDRRIANLEGRPQLHDVDQVLDQIGEDSTHTLRCIAPNTAQHWVYFEKAIIAYLTHSAGANTTASRLPITSTILLLQNNLPL